MQDKYAELQPNRSRSMPWVAAWALDCEREPEKAKASYRGKYEAFWTAGGGGGREIRPSG